MNPTQFAVRSSILSPRKPRIIAAYGETSGTDTINVTIPRAPGKLCVVVTASRGGGSPSLLTGFTSLGLASSGGTSDPGLRVQYKFLNGSEAVTLAMTSTGASATHAHSFLIDGTISSITPDCDNNQGNETPPEVNVSSPRRRSLMLVTLMSSNAHTTFARPFSRAQSIITTQNNALVSAWVENILEQTFTPGLFSGGSGTTKSFTVAVRSA